MFPRVQLAGGPRQRGRRYGEQARDRIIRSVEAYRRVFAHWSGWEWPRVTTEALRSLPAIAEFRPRYIDEMRGIAEGAGLAFEDILALNLRTEVMFAAKAHGVDHPSFPMECSSFAVLPAATENGHTLLGQNWDWLVHSADTVIVLDARPDDAPDFVTVVEAGLLAKTGLNSSGLGVVTNALISGEDVGSPGVPYHVVLRAILEAETTQDALAAIQAPVRSSSANYLVADRSGSALDIEAAPGDASRLSVLRPEDGILVHTNHFRSELLAGEDVTLRLAPYSPARLERLHEALSSARPVSVMALTRILGEHADPTSAICSHSDPDQDPLERTATVASVVMDLDDRAIRLAEGYPCTAPFHDLDLTAFSRARDL